MIRGENSILIVNSAQSSLAGCRGFVWEYEDRDMRTYQDLLTDGAHHLAGWFEPEDGLELSANPLARFAAWINSDSKRTRIAGRVVWVLALLLVLLATVVLIPSLGNRVWTSTSWSVGLFSAVWGLVVGLTLGLILPSKLVTAITGAAGALTISDLTSASYSTWLDSAAKQIAELVSQTPTAPDVFIIRLYVVVFLVFAGLASAPAFITD